MRLGPGRLPWSIVTMITIAVLSLAGASGWAQPSAVRYIKYPGSEVKVQPLEWKGIPKWATIDFQLRGRTENWTSYNYSSGNDQLFEATRVYAGLEVRPTSWLTGYIQSIDTHVLGLPLSMVMPYQRDVFDDRQAYAEFHHTFQDKNVELYAGRFELKYGGERLVGISDFTNNSRTWDGFLGRIGDKNRLDFFSTSVVAVHPSSLDKHGAGLTFHGAVGTIGTLVPHMAIQPFVYVKAFPRVLSREGVYGTQTTVTPGAEITGDLPGGFWVDALGALQRGSYSIDSISAAAGYAKAGYTFRRAYWKPRLYGEYDYASGNQQGNPQRFSTFDQQYPSNHNAFGLVDLLGFQNIKEERINLNLAPVKHVTLLLQEESLQVASRYDNVYNGAAGTVVKAPAAGFLSGDIGHEFDASGNWVIKEYLMAEAGVGHLSPGTLLRENKHGPPLTFTYFSLTYRLKVDRKHEAP